MRKFTVVAATLLLALVAFAPQASAVQLSGSFAVGGTFEWQSSATCVSAVSCPAVALGTANVLDFRIVAATPSPGVAGNGTVFDNSGSFIALAPLGSTVTMKDFSYLAPANALFPAAPITTWELTTGGATVDLLTMNVLTFCSAGCTFVSALPHIDITGTALFHMAGFDATPGVFEIQGGQVGSSFTFAAQNAVTVPEPATLMLLGLGLSGLAVAGRLKKR